MHTCTLTSMNDSYFLKRCCCGGEKDGIQYNCKISFWISYKQRHSLDFNWHLYGTTMVSAEKWTKMISNNIGVILKGPFQQLTVKDFWTLQSHWRRQNWESKFKCHLVALIEESSVTRTKIRVLKSLSHNVLKSLSHNVWKKSMHFLSWYSQYQMLIVL